MTDSGQIIRPLSDLLRSPDGPRDRQLMLGDIVRILSEAEGYCRVRTDKDGYEGYVPKTDLGEVTAATHKVSVLATHAYEDADLKSPDRASLSFGCRVAASAAIAGFLKTSQGFVPSQHLSPVGQVMSDPVEVAALFVGTPYLWGGNSRLGIDCSGLVQAALLACGHDCPGDSGDQERVLGTALPSGSNPLKGDLLFWKGHVAWVAGPDTLLHANAHHMAVQYEPLSEAIQRIEAQGDGPVTSHRRLDIQGGR